MAAIYNLFGFGVPAMAIENCCNCGVQFGMTEELYRKRREDSKGFFCPNGHEQVYRDSEATKLKRELEKEQQRRKWAEESRNDARAEATRQGRRAAVYKGKMNHIKHRVGNGVCPCCNRTFQNLMAHMKTKHPKFKKVIK